MKEVTKKRSATKATLVKSKTRFQSPKTVEKVEEDRVRWKLGR